jgi:hypothetical protein
MTVYLIAASLVINLVLGTALVMSRKDLENNRLALEQAVANVSMLVQERDTARDALKLQNEEQVKLQRSLRAARSRISELQDKEWLDIKTHRIPDVVLEEFYRE